MGKVPLPASFLLTGLLGLIVVAVYGYYGKLPLDWATAFGLVFLLMVIASFISLNQTLK